MARATGRSCCCSRVSACEPATPSTCNSMISTGAAGTVLVSGKGRREVRLPLPQEVGDALLAYIDHARPAVEEQRLFLRSCAPYRPFTSPSTISCIVSLALRRRGSRIRPSRGANLLRYSAATAMLRGGATLQSVGAVLRHRSLDNDCALRKGRSVDASADCPAPGLEKHHAERRSRAACRAP